MADDWKKIWWMVGRRSCGWLVENLVDDWTKIWWIVGRRYGGWFDEDLVKVVSCWKGVQWIFMRRTS